MRSLLFLLFALLWIASAAPVLTPVENVKDFGALGNGSSDDTTAIKNAVAAVPGTGGEVFFPCGNYGISSQVLINHSNVSLVGETAGCVTLRGIGSTSFVMFKAAGGGLFSQFPLASNVTASTFTLNAGGIASAGIVVGSYVLISDTGFASNGTGSPLISNQEVVKVTAISGDTATIEGTFSYPFSLVSPYPNNAGGAPFAQRVNSITNIFISNLSFDGTNNSGSSSALQLNYATQSEMGNVAVSGFVGLGGLSGGMSLDVGYQNSVHDITCTKCGDTGGGTGGAGGEALTNIRQSYMTESNITVTQSATQFVFSWSARETHFSTFTNVFVNAAGATGRPVKLLRSDHNTLNQITALNGTGGHNGISVTDISQFNTWNNCVANNNANVGILTFGNYNVNNTFNNCSASGNQSWQFGQTNDANGTFNDTNTIVRGGTFGPAGGTSSLVQISSNNATVDSATISDTAGGGAANGLVVSPTSTTPTVTNNHFSHLPANRDVYAQGVASIFYSGNVTPDGTTPNPIVSSGPITVSGFTQTAIVNAIASACNGSVPGTVIFPNGTYTVTSAVLIPANCSLQAQNQGVPIIQGSQNQVFSVNGNGVAITGLILDGGYIRGASGIQYSNINITFDTIRNYRNSVQGGGPAMIYFFALKGSSISNNSFSNIWGGGSACCAINLVGTENIDQFGAAGIQLDSIDQTVIQNNTFNQIANDGMHIDWLSTTSNTGLNYTTTGNIVAYNIFKNIHRIPIEMQSQPGGNCPGGCNFATVNTQGMQVKGNFMSHYLQGYYDQWGASLVPDGSKGSQYLNNTYVEDQGNQATCCAPGQETSADNGVIQGEVIANVPGTAQGFSAALAYGGNSNPSFTITTQENVWCGNSWISKGGAWTGSEGTGHATVTEQFNYKDAATCPAGADPSVSRIVPTWTSANNQSFPTGGNGTWSLNVVSNLSIRYVQFFLDSQTTPIVFQELQDVNTNFATDRKWLYHATFSTTGLINPSHTISAVLTDVSGATSTITQTFTVGNSGTGAAIAPAALSYSAGGVQSATVTNTGTGTLSITGASFTGANPGDFSQTTTCGATLAAGASCFYNVTFAPLAIGTRTTTLAIANNSSTNPLTVALTGLPNYVGNCAVPVTNCKAAGGQAVSLTFGSPATASLVAGGVGTLTHVDSTHVEYTAPVPTSLVKATNAAGGCLIQPNDSVFNTRIDNLPVNSNSAAWVNNFGNTNFTWVPGWDLNVVDSSVNTIASPLYFYTPVYNALPLPVPNTPNRKRESGAIAFYTEVDHHLVSVNRQTCQIQETYQDATGVGVPGPNHGLGCNQGLGQSLGCDATSAWQYYGYSYTLPTNGSTDGAALPLEPLTLRASEVRLGVVNHALRFTTNSAECRNTFLWPAGGGDSNCSSSASAAPAGSRFRMKASVACPVAGTVAATICTALKQYGLVWADITAGSNPQIVTSTDMWYDPAVANVLQSLLIPSGNFEAVDESSLIENVASAAVLPNNGFVTPSNAATITYGTGLYQPIAVTPVTVGVTEQYLAIPAGGSFTPQAWVNGASDPTVNWTVVGGGTVTAGLYTAPALGPGASAAVTLTGCSAVDPSACTFIFMTVLANHCKPGDTTMRVCIDSGAKVSYGPDAFGDNWTADAIPTGGTLGLVNNNAAWQFQTDGTLFQTWLINGYDIDYNMVGWPAGNYKITIGQGQGYTNSGNAVCNFNNGWPATYAAYPDPNGPGPAYTMAQNQIVSYYMDPSLPPINNGQLCFNRSFYSMPATVDATGTLQFGLAGIGSNAIARQVNSSLATVKIEQDSTPPFMAIDLLGHSDMVFPTQTVQMNVTWWYLTPTAVTWTMTGPGSISGTGLYTAPGSQAITAPAVITASDTQGHSVSQTLWVQGAAALGLIY